MRKERLEDSDLPVTAMMRRWPETMSVFIAHGMLCVGCLIGPFHTLDDACAAYGIDPDTLLAELRAAVRSAAARAARAGAVE